jgi:uncharacterized protein YndB with AHSA1/START domain
VNADSFKSGARALADVGAGLILATVQMAASPERVFRALSDPRELMEWWGSPDSYRAHRWDSDFRVGGAWRVEGKSVDGRPYSVGGRFLEIDPPRKLVQTWLPDWDKATPETTITYTLDAIPGGTRLTMRHEGFGQATESCSSHAKGWERVLGWLADHVDSPAQPGL